MTYCGGCHCGKVRFEFTLEGPLKAFDCNCSICLKTAYVGIIVPKENISFTIKDDALATYTFNTHTAKHHFCKICGIKSFYVPRSHPDAYSVNGRCLDDFTKLDIKLEAYDGQNWEKAHDALSLKDTTKN